jgi:hypothetical protein
MPVFDISTNVSKDNIPADFYQKATEKMAEALLKPAQVSEWANQKCINKCRE